MVGSTTPNAPFGQMLTAMITPMLDNGEVDYDGVARLATYLVDENGGPVARDDGSFRELPLVVGEGAADDAIVMIRTLERYPSITRDLAALSPFIGLDPVVERGDDQMPLFGS